jgi:hypothetical protein
MKKVLLLAVLALAACSEQGAEEAAPAPEATQQAGTTTTAAAQQFTARELVAKVKQAGLPIGKVDCFTEETDPNDLLGRPGGYTSKCDWADKREEQYSADDLIGGSFEVFDTAEDAAERAEYLKAFEGQGALSTGYTYIVPDGGTTVLRVDADLTSKQAEQYKRATLKEVRPFR